MLPRKSMEGAKDLASYRSAEGIAQVIIPDANIYKKILNSLLAWEIPSERTFFYTPPGTVGNKRLPREEKIPKVIDPSLTYVVLDDMFERGGTLKSAVQRLEEQEVKDIWFFAACISEYIPTRDPKVDGYTSGFLDRAEVFLKYRQDVPSGRPEWANDPELAARLFGKK